MMFQSIVALCFAAAEPAAQHLAIVLPIDLGVAYLSRPEVLDPAIKRALSESGVKVLVEGEVVPAVEPQRAHELFSCKKAAKKCIPPILEAGLPATVIVRSQISSNQGARGLLLQAYSVPEGQLLSTFFEGGVEGEERLAEILAKGARQLGADLVLGSRSTPEVTLAPGLHATTTDPVFRRVGWGLLAASVASGVFGGITLVRRAALLNAPLADDVNLVDQDRQDTLKAAEEQRVSAVVGLVAAGVLVVPAAIMLYLGFKPTPVTFDLIPGTSGLMFTAHATF